MQVYGYEPQLWRGGLSIKLDNMNNGLTQVVLVRFKLRRWTHANSRLPVDVRLTYYDLGQKRVVKADHAFITVGGRAREDLLEDNEVGKNFTIAQLAQAIRDMTEATEARRYREAERLLANAIDRTYRRYPNLDDEDIKRTLRIAERYQENLRRYNQNTDSRDDR